MSFSVNVIKRTILPAAPAMGLILGTVIAVYLALWTGKEGSTSQEPISVGVLETLPVGVTFDSIKHVQKTGVFASVKDPFVLPKTEDIADAEELPQLRLSMIVINKRHKMCKVNGKLYAEGEKGPDFQIKFIGEEKVLIERRGRGQWLFLARNS